MSGAYGAIMWARASVDWPAHLATAGMAPDGRVYVSASLVSEDELFVGVVAAGDRAEALVYDGERIYVEADWALARAPLPRRPRIASVVEAVRRFHGWVPA